MLAEGLAAIAGIVTWHKWKHGYLKWFVIYLTVIFAGELLYWALILYAKGKNAGLIHNIVIPLEILFISWFFYKTLSPKNKTLIIAGVACYVSALVLEKTLLSSISYYFQSLSYTAGNLFILIYIILFFIQIANSEKILAFKKLAVFWIVCGMLVFYLGTFPFYGLYNELAKNLDIFMPAAWVATSLNYCMYLLFTIGLIWGKPH